jgi:uncharacterized protein (TIGR02646 family)
VRRYSIPSCPEALAPTAPAAARERELARQHYGSPETRDTPFDGFAVYRSKPVKAALEDAFGMLCAYCETNYQAGSPGDVEHYRPKSAVITPTGKKRGYWWLASTWENLLPSCKRCNSRERHKHGRGPVRVSGKGTHFPLVDEDARATAPGEEAQEEPLLLHPYYDDPNEHLEFVEEGLLRPRQGSVRGRETIELLGLNRDGLLQARRDHLVTVEAHIARIIRAEERMEKYAEDDSFREERDREVAELARLLERGQRYSTMVAQRIRAAGPRPGPPLASAVAA